MKLKHFTYLAMTIIQIVATYFLWLWGCNFLLSPILAAALAVSFGFAVYFIQKRNAAHKSAI